jgi:hypothetical protein
MPGRQLVPGGKRFRRDRLAMLLHCDVNNRSNGENGFTRQQWHGTGETLFAANWFEDRANNLATPIVAP